MANRFHVRWADESTASVDITRLFLVTFNGTFDAPDDFGMNKLHREDYPDIELLSAEEAVRLASHYNNDHFRPEFRVWAEAIGYPELYRRRDMECTEINRANHEKWQKESDARKAARRRKRLASAKKRVKAPRKVSAK